MARLEWNSKEVAMNFKTSTTYADPGTISTTANTPVSAMLLPIIAGVFVAYLVIGLAMPGRRSRWFKRGLRC